MRAADTDTDSSAAADTSGMSVCVHTRDTYMNQICLPYQKECKTVLQKKKKIKKNLNYFSFAKPELFRVA